MTVLAQPLLQRLSDIDVFERSNERYNSEVRAHGIRVGALAADFMFHLTADHLSRVEASIAGRFHDIGKASIPTEILFKPGRLNEQERATINTHTQQGAALITQGGLEAPDFLLYAILYHHERWDGGGYHGLRGEEIPFLSRVICIIDTFDALQAERAYKRGMTEGEALTWMVRNSEKMANGRRSCCYDPVQLRQFAAWRLEVSNLIEPAARQVIQDFAGTAPSTAVLETAILPPAEMSPV